MPETRPKITAGQGLRVRGKPGKVALTAVMRKLVMQQNAIAVSGTPWAPKPAPAG